MPENTFVPELLPNRNLTIVENRKAPREPPKYLNKEIIHERLIAIDNPKDKMLLTFLWMSGVRISEAISIHKGDIDAVNREIRIKWLKNRKWTERNIPTHPNLMHMLSIYSAAMKQDDKLFPISRQRAYQICIKWMNINPHALRHSFAINCKRAGVRDDDLKKLLGHKSLNTTAIYSNFAPADLNKTIEKVEF